MLDTGRRKKEEGKERNLFLDDGVLLEDQSLLLVEVSLKSLDLLIDRAAA